MTARLLAGWYAEGRPADWAAHLRRHGPLPVRGGRRAGAELLDLVDASGLRGRGGAGFPTGRKLRTVAAGGKAPVVVANGCEGEPASAKDAALLHVAPHLVLDGIAVAAHAVGAGEAHLCLHRGAPGLATVRAALRERPATGRPRVRVHEVPPRYVASEESALVSWLNGGDARPTFTPPRPFERGVAGRPTLVQNVETLAHLALVARHGADWFRATGDPAEPGTLLLTVSGAVARPGVYELPTGRPVAAALAAAGGSTGPLAALLVGGYFGTWLPVADALPLGLTQAALREAGGALGAGILLALPAEACGLAETAHVLGYLAGESARQCGPCLHGLPAIAGALHRLAHGPVAADSAANLTRWLGLVPGRGACRHPDGAVRLAASALRVFAPDVAGHAAGRPCAAAARPPLLPVAPRDAGGGWR